MFDAKTYVRRRNDLKKNLTGGILLFQGNDESPMNYADNGYPFRQDSTFLYYFGLDSPGLFAVIDLDSGEEIIFGSDFTVDDIIWMGPQPTLQERAEQVGVTRTASPKRLEELLAASLKDGRNIRILPPYRAEHSLKLSELLGIHPNEVEKYVSIDFIKKVIEQRSVKSPEEVAEIEKALDVAFEMQTWAMKNSRPGMIEREVSGKMQGIAAGRGSGIAFPIIFSIHGETLHNHYHGNKMQKGDLAVNDSGAESVTHYASDITRTIPVGGKFTARQREIYEIVLKAQLGAIEAIRPGIQYKDVHLKAARIMVEGLKELGIMKGAAEAAVSQGVHALFFPHGLGHMMGLDVHDMENLGEDLVGYDESVQRSEQFGLDALRLARELKPGFVLTVEPGIYFIPALIDQWQKSGKFEEFLNYDKLEDYRDFGGIRIEDDVLVTDQGCRVLGKPIPKSVGEVEELASG